MMLLRRWRRVWRGRGRRWIRDHAMNKSGFGYCVYVSGLRVHESRRSSNNFHNISTDGLPTLAAQFLYRQDIITLMGRSKPIWVHLGQEADVVLVAAPTMNCLPGFSLWCPSITLHCAVSTESHSIPSARYRDVYTLSNLRSALSSKPVSRHESMGTDGRCSRKD